MTVAQKKIALAQRVLETDDKQILKELEAVFVRHNEDWWDTLPDRIKESVDRGLKQSEKGVGVSHELVMKKMEKWLKK
jgi:hypothetical protein